MFMDPHQNEFYDNINGFTPYDEDILPIFDQNRGVTNGYTFKNHLSDLSFLDLPHPALYPNPGSSSVSPDLHSHEDSPDEFNDCVFNFIDQILVDENVEGKQSLFCDPLELQATERSFYEALGQEYPSPSQPPPILGPGPCPYLKNSEFGSSGDTNSSTSYSNSTQPEWPGYTFDSLSSVTQTTSLEPSPLWSFDSTSSVTNDELLNTHIAQNIFTDSESIKQFNRGMEEASKFLPSTKPLIIDLDKYDLPQDSKNTPLEVAVKVEKDHPSNGLKPSPALNLSNGLKPSNGSKQSNGRKQSNRPNVSNGLKGKKHYPLEDNSYEEERSSKQSAVYVEEDDLSEMFDKVLLGGHTQANDKSVSSCYAQPIQVEYIAKQNGARDSRNARKQTSKMVDLSTLLVNCAQAVAAGDQRTATEQINQIKQHASSSGDASQRLAHVFATGIEARLAGTGSQLYKAKCAVTISAYEKLKAYQVYLSACPFKKIGMMFANKTIFDAALSSSSTTIHIVDFGIAYGFQWPIFMKHLSELPNGPPKLRITGIEYPQAGFRPAERLEESGRCLARYCARFNIPFEYNAIATQNWETIKIEDLKLQRNEFLAVNSMIRFQNLLDETVCDESPRDKVLKLIRDMNPDVFVHSVVNGAYSAPFFVTRFRETLFHYSALFDMFDSTLDRDNEQRYNFEKEFYGREAMNVIACEGAERVERPESYKQWQVRISRAGFKLKPLDPQLVSVLRYKRAGYHKDFVFDDDGKWILQGWKGRILYASSCWVPARS